MVYKKTLFTWVCFFLLFGSFNSYSHAVYVSVCNVYEKKERSYFSFRVFKDDIYDALGLVGSTENLSKKEKEDVVRYIQKNFLVSVDGKVKGLVLDRFIFEGSDYTETANLVFILNEQLVNKTLKIRNTILFDVLEEQTNIIGVKIKNTRRTLTFNKNKKENWVQIK
mgnify:CR=1 FL=1